MYLLKYQWLISAHESNQDKAVPDIWTTHGQKLTFSCCNRISQKCKHNALCFCLTIGLPGLIKHGPFSGPIALAKYANSTALPLPVCFSVSPGVSYVPFFSKRPVNHHKLRCLSLQLLIQRL